MAEIRWTPKVFYAIERKNKHGEWDIHMLPVVALAVFLSEEVARHVAERDLAGQEWRIVKLVRWGD